MDRESLLQLMSFPGTFTFRVVADSAGDLRARCVGAVEGALGRPVEGVEERPSGAGRYRAVRIRAVVQDPDEVLAAYAALGSVPGLRMLL